MNYRRMHRLCRHGISKQWFEYEIDWDAIRQRAMAFGWLQLAVIAIILVVIRRIVIRLSLPDTRLNSE
jgi:hypothetical protein